MMAEFLVIGLQGYEILGLCQRGYMYVDYIPLVLRVY